MRNKRGSPLEEVAERLPVRSRQQLGVPTAHSLLDPAGAHGSIPAGIRSASEHGLSALSDLARTPASPPPGALDDDPLTSPSFAAVPGTDSRSYGKARKHAAPAHASPPAAEFDRENGYRGHHSGSHHVGAYLAADHLGADYEQLPGPASRTPVPSAGERYAAPGEQHSASAYSNPYGGPVSSAVGTMQPRLGGGQAAAGYSGDGSGEASGYVQPAYQPPATEHYAGWSAGPFPPQPLGAPLQELDGADHAGYLDGYSAQLGYGDSPLAGRPGPGGYASSTGHAPGYDRRHVTDPYRAGGYDGYPAQG